MRYLIFLQLVLTTFNIQAFDLVTYNLGLAHTYVPFAVERTPFLIDALKQTDADVLCLQELWTPEDINTFNAALIEQYPYSTSPDFKQDFADKIPACSLKKILGKTSVGRCILRECRKKQGDEFTQCVLDDCANEIEKIKNEDPDCAKALFAQVGGNLVKGLLKILSPFKRVGLFAWDGSAGLAIFSKHKIEKSEVRDFYDISTLIRRAAVYAKVNVDGSNKHVLCTHLTANLLNVPYVGPLDSWIAESEAQANELVKFAEERSRGEDQFIAGDFNCSFGDEAYGIGEQAISTCSIFTKNGYSDPVQSLHECTFCEYNNLNLEKTNFVLDHIFVKSSKKKGIDISLILKDEITLDNGESIYLSDHFGVLLRQF